MASAALMAGCTDNEVKTAFATILGCSLAAVAGLWLNELRRWIKTKESEKIRKIEEDSYEEEKGRRIELITKHIEGKNTLPEAEFLKFLTNDIDTTSVWADYFNYDSYRCDVLEECGKQFGLIFSQGQASERIKTLFTKVFVEPRTWNGKSHFFFDALAKAIPHDPAYVMDCLLDIAEKIKTGTISMAKGIFEKLKAQITIILVSHGQQLSPAQQQRAKAIVES